jgi:hypothetical protein
MAGPQRIRKDPPRRPTDSLLPYNAVKNPKPGFHYVLVSLDGKETTSPEYYEMLGWAPVIYTGAKGTCLGWGKWKDGEAVTNMGQILMEMSDERWDQLEEFGMNGNSGQAHLRQLAQQIGARGGIDPVRAKAGMGAKQMTSSNIEEDTSGFLS